MSDDQSPRFHFHLTPRHKRPGIPSIADAKPCPDHPGVEPGIGFGMAGGGYGTYMHCEVCGRILGKDEEPAE